MKAVIGISNWSQTRDELRALAKKIDAGKRLPEADYQLNFPSPVELLAELPPKRLQILRELKSAGTLSVYALAKRLGRNYSNVHGDIQRLHALGLVEKTRPAKCWCRLTISSYRSTPRSWRRRELNVVAGTETIRARPL